MFKRKALNKFDNSISRGDGNLQKRKQIDLRLPFAILRMTSIRFEAKPNAQSHTQSIESLNLWQQLIEIVIQQTCPSMYLVLGAEMMGALPGLGLPQNSAKFIPQCLV